MKLDYYNELEQLKKSIDELAIPLVTNNWQEADAKLKNLLPLLKSVLQKLLQEQTVNEQDKLAQQQLVNVLDHILKAWQWKDCVQLSDLLQYDLYNLFEYYLEKKSGDK